VSKIIAHVLVPLLLLAAPLTPARAAEVQFSIESDAHGQPTIVVSGAGSSVALAEIRAGLGAEANLLTQPEQDVWQLNANLLVGRDVRLRLAPEAGVRELRLRSEPGRAGSDPAGYDYSRFVYLRAENATVSIKGVTVRSWDPATGNVDADPTDGRAFILAKYASRLDIAGSDLGYLGSADGESYGVAWRDVNDPASPDTLRRRVTGEVADSRFHHNFYGVYTFQASGMVFRRNQFDHNLGYGFDPHDYSADFLVEDNSAFENGNHGFIISRGCTGFVFRRNLSRNNRNPDPVKLAHGFMLDPGSPNSADPQAASTKNLLEQNQAYDNEGYGLRILGSTENVVRGNIFERNRQGITVEQGSTGNTIEGNSVALNQLHGIFVRGGADSTRLSENILTGNGGNGIYIKANRSTIVANSLSGNGGEAIILLPESGPAAARADLALPDADPGLAGVDDELVGEVATVDQIDGAEVRDNSVERSGGHGVELKGVRGAELRANTIVASSGHGVYLADGTSDSVVIGNTIIGSAGNGIRANGAATAGNSWSDNRLEGGVDNPGAVTAGANGGVSAPKLALAGTGEVTGTAGVGATVELLFAVERGNYAPAVKVTASEDGSFHATFPENATALLAIATTPDGNSSAAAALTIRHMLHLPLVR
jgi:parallel beta-helix repeat protein